MSLRSWLRRWIAEGHDPALTVTGVRQIFSGHEQHKASAAYRRSRGETPSGRAYQPKGNVVEMRKTR